MKKQSKSNTKPKSQKNITISTAMRPRIPRTVVNVNDGRTPTIGVMVEYDRTLDWYQDDSINSQFVLGSVASDPHTTKTVQFANIRLNDPETSSELYKYRLLYDQYRIENMSILIKPMKMSPLMSEAVVFFKYVSSGSAPSLAEMENQDPIVKLQGQQDHVWKINFPKDGKTLSSGVVSTWKSTASLTVLPTEIGTIYFETNTPVTQIGSDVRSIFAMPAYKIYVRVKFQFRKPVTVDQTNIAGRIKALANMDN